MSAPELPPEPSVELAVRPESPPLASNELGTDNALVAMWLHGRSPHTVRAYSADVERFSRFVHRKPLAHVTLADLQAFDGSLGELSDSSRARTLNAVRSLLAFAQRTGVLAFNVGAALRVPQPRATLADRILTEKAVRAMKKAALARSPRDAALIHLLYDSAFRRSEVAGLRWQDAVELENGEAALTVLGKRRKTRTVRVSAATWSMVSALRGDAPSDAPIFVGRSGALDPSSLWRIVRATARRAGLEQPVSTHWMRHAHCSHAIERGAPLPLVQQTLGHASLATTSLYAHARPSESSGRYLR